MAEFFEQLQEEDSDALQIVFVSSDRDQASFDQYYGTMPWAAVPLANSEIKQKLSGIFSVRGIPFFVILDSNGSIKDADGRTTVASARGDVSKATAKWA